MEQDPSIAAEKEKEQNTKKLTSAIGLPPLSATKKKGNNSKMSKAESLGLSPEEVKEDKFKSSGASRQKRMMFS